MSLSRPTICRLLALCLLGGMALQRSLALNTTSGAREYRARIRAAAQSLPRQIGPWVGRDVPQSRQATAVLQPNVMVSRSYLNVETGVTAGLLLVHCANAHQMVGHFPKRCYPADGWTLTASRPRDWDVDGLLITGTEYEFTKTDLRSGAKSIVVANCLLRPGKRILRNMVELTRSMIGATGSSSGAGQIQVYFDSDVPEAQRNAAIRDLFRGCRPVIDRILAEPGS